MLKEIQDAIIDRLREIPEAMTVDAWQGAEDLLIEQAQRFPSLWVIYQGAFFTEKKVIGSDRADHAMTFLVILVHKNLASRRKASEEAYALVESARAKLVGHKILTYGWLCPVREELLLAENGLYVYGLEYRMQTNT